MFVLIGIDAKGRPVEVGVFDDELKVRKHASRNTREGCRYSVYTPDLNDVIAAPAVIGISNPEPYSIR